MQDKDYLGQTAEPKRLIYNFATKCHRHNYLNSSCTVVVSSCPLSLAL